MTSPPAKASVDEKERSILAFWRENGIFQKSVRKNRKKDPFVFFEGPPTANGRPGIHHVLARVYKDIYIRFYNQLGYYVPRRAGWDCHGLPVEREVEKKLGIQTKSEIEERVGIEEFNRLCRESVLEYVRDWNTFSERMGFWIDLDDAYFTMDDSYIESVWSLLKKIHERGLLYRGYKVVPYDTVMGATMSDAEVALGYRTVSDPSLTVRFAVKDSRFPDASFLVWTTTPWTLPSNVALALHPDEDYVLCESNAERFICAESLARSVLGEDVQILKKMKGLELLSVRYEPLFPWEDESLTQLAYRTIAGRFVTMDTGTGIVHIAPAYGADDLSVALENELPVLHAVGLDGRFQVELPFRGLFFKEADPLIIKNLKERGLVHKSERYEHEYPFGYRTGSPLIYYAKHAWYIRTTDLREELLEQNQTISWIPDHIKAGRFGRWLENNRDWALSRERYWGTPLPVWMDDDGNMAVIGSRSELEALCGRKLKNLDLHRPAIDQVQWTNPRSGKVMRRVPEVIDCWFDSGAMPYAQWGYPVKNADRFEEAFPADFISEAVDQTRGWFYTLLAIGVMISGRSPYRNVICLGHVVDAKGEKMSKSKGNTVAPQEIFEHHGADALRWYFLTGAPPGQPRRVGRPGDANDPLAVVHGFFNMVRNSCDFFSMYARVDGVTIATGWQKQAVRGSPPFAKRPAMDRWLLSRAQVLTTEVTRALKSYDSRQAGILLEEFADQLSNWYIRRNRRRFWRGELDLDKKAAYDTLFSAIMTLLRLLAVFTPFFAEELFRELMLLREEPARAKKKAESIHLLEWPQSQMSTLFDQAVLREGNLVQKAAGLGRSARTQAGVRIRQPLALLLIHASDREDRQILKQNAEILLEELNVKNIEFLEDSSGVLDYRIRPDLKILGKRLGPRLKALQEELARRPHRDIVENLKLQGKIAFELQGFVEEFTATDFLIDSLSRPGIAGAEAPGLLVALDTELTEDLKREGLARDVVRQIQESRKQAGLMITDRIILSLQAEGDLARAIEEFRTSLTAETLATMGEKKGPPLSQQRFEIQDHTLHLKFWKA